MTNGLLADSSGHERLKAKFSGKDTPKQEKSLTVVDSILFASGDGTVVVGPVLKPSMPPGSRSMQNVLP